MPDHPRTAGAPEAAIDLDAVSRRFGDTLALSGVSLRVPRGAVMGLVGENGAGKTTLIRHVLGLLRPLAGSVRVFGLDPVKHPVEVLGRIGYLSEERDLPGWMRVGELLRYTKAFYPAWDDALAEELRRSFGLDPRARVRDLSQGQRARAGLVAALAYRPDLLVLDEPSGGLDPAVRLDILAAVIRTVAEEGRTVLFSSHLLDEVERVCDHVAMIHQGRLAFAGSLEEIRSAHLRATLRFDAPPPAPPRLAGAVALAGGGREWTTIYRGSSASLAAEALAAGGRVVDESSPTLDELFLAWNPRGPGRPAHGPGAPPNPSNPRALADGSLVGVKG